MKEKRPGKQTVAPSGRPSLAAESERPRRPSEIYAAEKDQAATRASWQGVALSAGFVISIALPLAGMMLGLDPAFALVENRTLASRPELKLNRALLAEFPARFEAYFNDRFGFRKRLIHWLNIVRVAGLGVSPSSKVVLGRNGWLFHGDLYLDYYRAITPFAPAKLAMWQHLLESRRDWLAARGVPYLVVFVPTKSAVYPEYMPLVYNRARPESRLDQLKAHLKSHSSLTILDLREPLLAAKSDGRIYYRTDTHWNNGGAYVGYSKIIEALAAWFPHLEAVPRSELCEQTISEPGRNLARMLAMSDYYRDRYADLALKTPRFAQVVPETVNWGDPPRALWTGGPDIVYERPDRKLPRAVMFRDSFATWLIPFLSEHFQRIVYSWQYTLERALVEREHPDVVIQEILERALMDWDLPSQ